MLDTERLKQKFDSIKTLDQAFEYIYEIQDELIRQMEANVALNKQMQDLLEELIKVL